jgi:hypothetical protein
MIIFQTQGLSIKGFMNISERFAKCMVELYIKLKFYIKHNNIPNIYIWEIHNFVIKNDNFVFCSILKMQRIK